MSQAERIAPPFDPAVVRPAWRPSDLSESRLWAYYLLLPSLLLVAAVALYPVASGVWLSFQRYNLLRNPKTCSGVWTVRVTVRVAGADRLRDVAVPCTPS